MNALVGSQGQHQDWVLNHGFHSSQPGGRQTHTAFVKSPWWCTSPRGFEAPPGASVPREAQLLPSPEPQTCGKGSAPNSALGGRCCITCAGDKLSITGLFSCWFNNELTVFIQSADSRNAGGRPWILNLLLLEVFNWLVVHLSLVCSLGSASTDSAVSLPCTVSTHNFQAHFRALYFYPFNSWSTSHYLCLMLCGTGLAEPCTEEHC